MNQYQKQILLEIKKKKNKAPSEMNLSRYLGTSHKMYFLSTPQRREIVKNFVQQNKNLNKKDLLTLVNSLYAGESFEEKAVASGIVRSYLNHFYDLAVRNVEKWLKYLEGWAEIDILCMGFDDGILNQWGAWRKLLQKLSQHKNIGHRRASLVILTKPVYVTSDSRLKKLAFANIEHLKSERDILITKAVSWLLRAMIKNHSKEVKDYLRKNEASLPRIAFRETSKKIATGKKN